MTTQQECTAAAPVVTVAAGWATLAAFGAGGAVQNVDQRLFVTDGDLTGVRNTTPQLGPSLTAAAAALTTVGQGGTPSPIAGLTLAQSYASWASSVLLARGLAAANGDALSAKLLATAAAILNNLAAGV